MMRWLKSLRYSLSARLMLLFLGASLVALIVVGVGFRLGFAEHFRHQLRPHLLAYLDYVGNDLGDPPAPARAAVLAARLPGEIHLKGPEIAWSSSGSWPEDGGYRRRHGDWEVAHHGNKQLFRSRRGEYQVVYEIAARPDRGPTPLGLATLGGVLLVLLLLFLAIRRLFRPLQTLSDGVRRIGAGDLRTRMPVLRRDELGELTDNVNRMADRIEQMLEAKRQLLLAISHELRSPLTRAGVSVALLEPSSSADAIARDLKTMNRLIEELLDTERLGGSHSPLQRSQVYPGELAAELLREFFPDSGIGLELRGDAVGVQLDVARIRLLLRNLVENALNHSTEGGMPPTVLVRQDANKVTFRVRNQGRPICSQQLPHLTEPFYRADPSRRRATGGYGLGLYLCRLIAEAHGGALSITSSAEEGTVVTVILPVDSTLTPL